MPIIVSPILNDPAYKQSFTFFDTTGQYVDRKWVNAPSDFVTAHGSIQPVPRSDLHELANMMPSGIVLTSAILVITSAPLKCAVNGEPVSNSGSTIVHKGINWKVIDIEDYGVHGHIEAIAVRIDGQQDPRTTQPDVVTVSDIYSELDPSYIEFNGEYLLQPDLLNGFPYWVNSNNKVMNRSTNGFWSITTIGTPYSYFFIQSDSVFPPKENWVPNFGGGVPTINY